MSSTTMVKPARRNEWPASRPNTPPAKVVVMPAAVASAKAVTANMIPYQRRSGTNQRCLVSVTSGLISRVSIRSSIDPVPRTSASTPSRTALFSVTIAGDMNNTGTSAGRRSVHSQSVCRLTSLPRNLVCSSIQASTEVARAVCRFSGLSVVVVAICVSLRFPVSPARVPGKGCPASRLLLLRGLGLVRFPVLLVGLPVLARLAVGLSLRRLMVLRLVVRSGRVRLAGSLVLLEAAAVGCARPRRPEDEELEPVQPDLRRPGHRSEDDKRRGAERSEADGLELPGLRLGARPGGGLGRGPGPRCPGRLGRPLRRLCSGAGTGLDGQLNGSGAEVRARLPERGGGRRARAREVFRDVRGHAGHFGGHRRQVCPQLGGLPPGSPADRGGLRLGQFPDLGRFSFRAFADGDGLGVGLPPDLGRFPFRRLADRDRLRGGLLPDRGGLLVGVGQDPFRHPDRVGAAVVPGIPRNRLARRAGTGELEHVAGPGARAGRPAGVAARRLGEHDLEPAVAEVQVIVGLRDRAGVPGELRGPARRRVIGGYCPHVTPARRGHVRRRAPRVRVVVHRGGQRAAGRVVLRPAGPVTGYRATGTRGPAWMVAVRNVRGGPAVTAIADRRAGVAGGPARMVGGERAAGAARGPARVAGIGPAGLIRAGRPAWPVLVTRVRAIRGAGPGTAGSWHR